jgi:ABC-type transporter Mla subunit MlaD
MLPFPDPRDLLTLLPRLTGLLSDVEALVARIEETRRSADALVQRISGTVDRIEEPITTLQPVLERLAETTDPREVDALVTVIDQLPAMSGVVGTMTTVAPDLHRLLEVSVELNEMLAKVPFLNRDD